MILHTCRYQHLCLISAIAENGELIWHQRSGSFDGEAVVEFLEALIDFAHQDILVIWDGALIHRSIKVKEFLKTERGSKVWLERIPPYSPELNADEQVWNYLKSVILKNVSVKNLQELKPIVKDAMTIIQNSSELIRSFFKHPSVGYYGI